MKTTAIINEVPQKVFLTEEETKKKAIEIISEALNEHFEKATDLAALVEFLHIISSRLISLSSLGKGTITDVCHALKEANVPVQRNQDLLFEFVHEQIEMVVVSKDHKNALFNLHGLSDEIMENDVLDLFGYESI